MKCVYCGEKTDKETDIPVLGGRSAHEDCAFKAELNSTLKIFYPDRPFETYHFDEYQVRNEIESLDEYPEPIKKQKWVSSSPYRGYTDWEFVKGYRVIGDGWVTGFPDETTERKIELGEIYQKLENDEILPPVPLYWIFGVTSNVFSTASVLLVKKEDYKAIKKWLQEINGGVEGVKEALR